MNQIQVEIDLTGTQFGVKPPGVPMPKTIKLLNDGFKCPNPTKKASNMYVCCVKDPKFKKKKKDDSNKFLPRQYGDLNIVYDVLQAYGNNYLAQVTMDNDSPLSRLDNWNLTWEWKQENRVHLQHERRRIHTPEGFLLTASMAPKASTTLSFRLCSGRELGEETDNCMTPAGDGGNDDKIRKLPFCCKNGTLLPPTMNATKSHAIFQLKFFKMPPDLNRTALFPPQSWKINGFLDPEYKCGPPVRGQPLDVPRPERAIGEHTTTAVASWRGGVQHSTTQTQELSLLRLFLGVLQRLRRPIQHMRVRLRRGRGLRPGRAPLLLPQRGSPRPVRQPDGQGQGLGQAQA
ncbi:hypothetical protein J5N97_011478 [Dioscorea zingiberensis]|uniref:Uncharacterized protein n=1 Tax=Dioscorea zingiberensis TaxID=325984 RepID=A0A9D5HNN5_9LILI|nr:hypothetical protein J5N97_011478 [Dioscorea zingiberensis]